MTDQITLHSTEAIARLLEQFKDSENFKNLIRSYCTEIQEIEDELYKFFSMTLDGAEGVQLDNIYGKWVDRTRLSGESDDDYRLRIKARMLVLRSSGTPEQLLDIATLLSDVGYEIKEYAPAAFEMIAQDTLAQGQIIADELEDARSAGVNGKFRWTRHVTNETFTFNQSWIRQTVGVDKKMYAMAGDGTNLIIAGERYIRYSADGGETWALSYDNAAKDWFDAVYDSVNEIFIVCGNVGNIMTSSSGASGTWTARTSGTSQHLEDIATSGGTTIAVGGSGAVTKTTNGTAWTVKTSGTGVGLRSISNNGAGEWLAGGNVVLINSSDDGDSWTSISSDLSGGYIEANCLFYDFLYSRWVMCHRTSGGKSTIKSSTDKAIWGSGVYETSTRLHNITVLNQHYFAVGESGLIVYSADFENWYEMSVLGLISTELRNVIYRSSPLRYFIAGDTDGDATCLTLDYNPSGKGYGGFSPGTPPDGPDVFEGYWSEVS